MSSATEGRYLIWSHEHGRWWMRGGSGYTQRFSDAGLYSRESALDICANALMGARGVPNEVPVRFEDMQELARRSAGLTRVLD